MNKHPKPNWYSNGSLALIWTRSVVACVLAIALFIIFMKGNFYHFIPVAAGIPLILGILNSLDHFSKKK